MATINDFEKNSKWRTEIIDTITFLINMEGYQLKYLDRALGSYIVGYNMMKSALMKHIAN
jgi:hypothetical protein